MTYRNVDDTNREALVDLLATASFAEWTGGEQIVAWIDRAPNPYFKLKTAQASYEELRHGWAQSEALRKLGEEPALARSQHPTRAYQEIVHMYQDGLKDYLEFAVFLPVLGDPLGKIIFDDSEESGFEVLAEIAPGTQLEEEGHIQMGIDLVEYYVNDQGRKDDVQAAIDRLAPIVIRALGTPGSAREKAYLEAGVRNRTTAQIIREWYDFVQGNLEPFGLTLPPIEQLAPAAVAVGTA